MQKVLITGAAGFIGSHIAEKLLTAGYKVVGVDNLSGSYSKRVYQYILNLLNKSSTFSFYNIDILNQNKLKAVFHKQNYDYLIHCAAKTGVRDSIKKPTEYFQTNVIGTLNLLEAIHRHRLNTKIVLLSSSSVYGKQAKTLFNEKMVLNPISPYGFSKLHMELIAKQYSNLYKIPIVIIRPFSIYGPRGRIDMAPFLLLKSVMTRKNFIQYGNNLNNQRDWTFIDDFVQIIQNLLDRYQFKQLKIFNIGNSKPYGIEVFIEMASLIIKNDFNKEVLINKQKRPGIEMPIVCADINKAKRELQYKPKISLSVGLKRFFDYYKKNKQLYLFY